MDVESFELGILGPGVPVLAAEGECACGTAKRQEFLLEMVILTENTCSKQLISVSEMRV